MSERLHVLIAGGGLSGLALAQGLIKDGHTCQVFERDADDSRKIGYYLHMNADGGEAPLPAGRPVRAVRADLTPDLRAARIDRPGQPAPRAELAAAPRPAQRGR